MKLLSRRDAALELGVSTTTIHNYSRDGLIQKCGIFYDLDTYTPKQRKNRKLQAIYCDLCLAPIKYNSGNPDRAKRFCSMKCKRKGSRQSNIWKQEEIDHLERLLEKMPELMVVYQWEEDQKANGWRKRSLIAISRMCKLSRIPPGEKREFWTLIELGLMLGIHEARPSHRWIREGLATIKIPGVHRFVAVSREQIKKYAARRPKDFYGIPVSKLNKIFKDFKFSKEVFELGFADTRSQCFCIVRLEGGVFHSQGVAAKELQLGISSVENNIDREKDIKGHNLVRMDYPRYLAPDGYEKEFNELAGNIVIQIYQDLKHVEGYTKLGIQTVVVRQAVDISLVSFKAYLRNKSLGEQEDRTVEIIADFWREKIVNIFKIHQQIKNYNLSRKRIQIKLRARAYHLFSIYGDRQGDYFENFTDYFISMLSEKYLKSCLPYKVENSSFVNSDMMTLAECLASAYMKRPTTSIAIAALYAFKFFKENRPSTSINPEWAEHSGYEPQQTSEESSQSLQIVIEGLESLNISDSLKDECRKYISAFCSSGDSLKARESMGIDGKKEEEILSTLKQAALPF